MKKLIPLTFLLITFFTSNAQFETIDLSKFKLPEIKRHTLDLEFGGSNRFSSYSTSIDDIQYTSLRLNDNIRAKYSYYLNTDKKQKNIRFYVRSAADFLRDKDYDKNKYNNNQFVHTIDFGLDERYYPNSDDRWFMLWSPELYLNTNFNKMKETSEYDDSLKDKNFSKYLEFYPKFEIGGGIGRIEPVADLRRAIYILDDLFKKQKLSRIPNEGEVFQLASKISQLRNQRFFDSRLRNIYELKSLDSLLNKIGIVGDMDATYFTSLNDMWLYGDESRYTGTRLQITILGKLNYSFHKKESEIYNENLILNSNITKNNNYTESAGIDFSLDSYKPIGLKWQRYFSASFAYNHFFMNKVSEEKYEGSIQYSYIWFMNTRTNATFGLEGNYTKNYFSFVSDYENTIKCGVFSELNYYFSPRLKASALLSLSYYRNDMQNKSYNFSIINQLGISYSIF